MNETEFMALAEHTLDRIERQADDWSAREDVDLDIEVMRNGNVLNLVFEDGTTIVVNSQAAVQELWLAARSGGFHYRYAGADWQDTRGGPSLNEALSQICSTAAGVPLTIKL
jgi:CyaY protein